MATIAMVSHGIAIEPAAASSDRFRPQTGSKPAGTASSAPMADSNRARPAAMIRRSRGSAPTASRVCWSDLVSAAAMLEYYGDLVPSG